MDCNDDTDERTGDEQRRSTDRLSIDAMLELLGHPYRRGLVQYFVDGSDDVSTVDEVTTYLVARERDRTSDPPDREQVRTALFHVHLPELASAGVVEYDSRSREIRYRGHDRLESLLETIREWIRRHRRP